MKMKQFIAMMMAIMLLVGMIPFRAFAEDAALTETPDVSLKKTSAEQVDILPEMETYSLTNNIVGEVIAKAINNTLKNNQAGDASKNNDSDEYPMDPHDRAYYGDSLRVRELNNGNYLVYRDSYLLISQEDNENFSVSYSGDKRTAYISPAFSEAELEGKTGIVFLSNSLADDEILVFGGQPYHEDDKLVVPLAAEEDVTVRRLFSDGKLHYSVNNNHLYAPIDWNDDLSGTNWSGTITDRDVQNIDFGVDFDIWSGGFSLAASLDFSIDFEITTTGASNGRETSEAAMISIPVEDLFAADVIFNVQAEFDETPIEVKGSLLTNFEYTFSVTTGAEVRKFRTPVTISEFTVVNSEDYNKDINFYLGSNLVSRLGVIEIDLVIYTIGPILYLDQDAAGGCYITARYDKDQYSKPDPTMEEIHLCAQNGKDGCLSLQVEEKNQVALDIGIDFSPIFDPWDFPLYTDETLIDSKQYYESYTFQSGRQEGICPHKGYRIGVTVDTTADLSTEGAAVSYTPALDEFKPFASAVADKDGYAVLFAPPYETIQVTAELTNAHDSTWRISETVPLYTISEPQDLTITLELPEKHIYFKNSVSGEAANWPEDITFVPFVSTSVSVPDNIPELSGLQFVNWNINQDGSGSSVQPGAKLITRDDKTFWAQWDIAGNSWYVIYNAKGGENAPHSQIVERGQDDVLSSQQPEADTMVFRGWALSENASEPDYQPGDTLPYDSNKNVVVLYALWSPALFTISFDTDGGTEIAPITLPAGDAVTPPAPPTKPGFLFERWEPELPTVMPAADLTVKAIYEPDEPEIIGCDLVLGGTPNFRFYVYIPENFDSSGAYMTLDIHSKLERSYTRDFTEGLDIDGRKVFGCDVFSIEMAEPITATFHYGEGKSTQKTWSVKDYLEKFQGSDPAYPLTVATRNFGSYMQPYLSGVRRFTFGTGDLFDYQLMPAASQINPLESLPGYERVWGEKGFDPLILSSIGYYDTFDQDTKINIRLGFKLAPEAISVTVDGDPATAVVRMLNPKTCLIEIPNIAANDLGRARHVEVTAFDKIVYDAYLSALSYVSTVLAANRPQQGEAEALTAFYEYYVEANAYGNS